MTLPNAFERLCQTRERHIVTAEFPSFDGGTLEDIRQAAERLRDGVRATVLQGEAERQLVEREGELLLAAAPAQPRLTLHNSYTATAPMHFNQSQPPPSPSPDCAPARPSTSPSATSKDDPANAKSR